MSCVRISRRLFCTSALVSSISSCAFLTWPDSAWALQGAAAATRPQARTASPAVRVYCIRRLLKGSLRIGAWPPRTHWTFVQGTPGLHQDPLGAEADGPFQVLRIEGPGQRDEGHPAPGRLRPPRAVPPDAPARAEVLEQELVDRVAREREHALGPEHVSGKRCHPPAKGRLPHGTRPGPA